MDNHYKQKKNVLEDEEMFSLLAPTRSVKSCFFQTKYTLTIICLTPNTP